MREVSTSLAFYFSSYLNRFFYGKQHEHNPEGIHPLGPIIPLR
jgi:hypothetical protein